MGVFSEVNRTVTSEERRLRDTYVVIASMIQTLNDRSKLIHDHFSNTVNGLAEEYADLLLEIAAYLDNSMKELEYAQELFDELKRPAFSKLR